MSEYNLDVLGWYQFERLCQSLLKAKFGLRIEAWGGSGDLGRDAYCNSALPFHDELTQSDGPFVFQSKFVSGANAAGAKPMPLVVKAIHAEFARIRERRESGIWQEPRFYTLMTNAPLTGSQKVDVKDLLDRELPASENLVQSSQDMDALLDSAPDIRLAFPQILGLRDFTSILETVVNREITNRSRLALERGNQIAKVFVPTRAYDRALEVLDEHKFVVLTGPPEMGKTSIARMIALARSAMGWEAFDVTGPGDLLQVLVPEKRQVFVADDAFGTTEYDPKKSQEWARDLGSVIPALDSKHLLLLTSRPAPLKAALERVAVQGVEAFPSPGEVVVNADELSEAEKCQMLYRHAKAHIDDSRGRDLIRRFAEDVVSHPHFTPLRINRFVVSQLPQVLSNDPDLQGELMREALKANLEEPTAQMKISFEQLEPACKTVLMSMLEVSDSTLTFTRLERFFEQHREEDESRSAIDSALLIDQHFINLTTLPGEMHPRFVSWVHPSVRDLVIDNLMEDHLRRTKFLQNAGVGGVMLALSTAGGDEGFRLFPLLQKEKDWETLGARIKSLVPDLKPEEVDSLMSTLVEAARFAKSGDIDGQTRLVLIGVIADGLADLRNAWNEDERTCELQQLESFYEASICVSPPVIGPNLTHTWSAHIERVTDLVPDASLDQAEDIVVAGSELLDLIQIIRDNDPRWLRIFDEPKLDALWTQVIVELDEIRDHVGLPTDIDSEEPEDFEESPPEWEWYAAATRLLDRIAGEEGTLREESDRVSEALEVSSEEWSEYNRKHEHFWRPEPDEDDWRRRGRTGSFERFDVSRFFADL